LVNTNHSHSNNNNNNNIHIFTHIRSGPLAKGARMGIAKVILSKNEKRK